MESRTAPNLKTEPSGHGRSSSSFEPWVGQRRASLAVVALIALVVYLPGFWWGAPHATGPDRVHAWGVDDETPLGPLTEVAHLFHPSADQNLGYPLGYSLLAAAAYSPYLAFLKVSGGLRASSPKYPYGLADPVAALRTLTWIAHLLTVLLGVGVVVSIFDTARTVWNERTAIVAVALSLAISPMFYYARTGNVDVPVLFFIALSIAILARSVEYGLTPRRAIALGAAVGLALGTKESAAGAFLPMPIILAMTRRRGEAEHDLWAWLRTALIGVLAAVVALGLSSGLFLDPHRYFAHIDFLRGRISAAATGEVIPFTYPNTLGGHAAFARRMLEHLAALLTWPGLGLAALGCIWVTARERRKAYLILPGVMYLAFMFVTTRTAQLRYVLPAGIFVALFAARAVGLAWQTKQSWLRTVVILAAAYSLMVGVLQGLDLTYQMMRDSRHTAGAWLAARLQHGSRVEYFGANQKLPPLPAYVQTARATRYLGMFRRLPTDTTAMRQIVSNWEVTRPAFVIVIPDHSSHAGDAYDNTMPPQLYNALMHGDLRYKLVGYFKTQPLFPRIRAIPLDYPVVNPPIRIFAAQ